MPRLSSDSSGPDRYDHDKKKAFFAVFDRLRSTTAAARELGLNSNTCAGWVRKAGLRSHGKPGAGPHPGKEEFFRLRKAGLARSEAAQVCGREHSHGQGLGPGNPEVIESTRLPRRTSSRVQPGSEHPSGLGQLAPGTHRCPAAIPDGLSDQEPPRSQWPAAFESRKTKNPADQIRGIFPLVEVRGFEPLTFCMPCRRATNCAIPPYFRCFTNKERLGKVFPALPCGEATPIS